MTEDNFESIFNSEAPSTADETVETTVEPIVEETASEAADERIEDAASEAVEETNENRKGWVPVAAVQDARAKIKDRDKELEDLREQLAQYQAPNVRVTADPYDDPSNYTRQMQEVIRHEINQYKFADSQKRANATYGDETVLRASAWAANAAINDANFEQFVLNHHDPVDYIVSAYNRNQRITEIESDEAAYVRRRAAELGILNQAVEQTSTAATQPKVATNGPKSIAHASSANRNSAPSNSNEAFAAIFQK